MILFPKEKCTYLWHLSSELRCDIKELQILLVKTANNTNPESKRSTLSGADLFGVEFHLELSLWEKLDVVCPVDFPSNSSNLFSNRKLERNTNCLEL